MIFTTLTMENFQDTSDGVKIQSQRTYGTHSNQLNMLNTNLLQEKNKEEKLSLPQDQVHQKTKLSNLNGMEEKKWSQEESLMPMAMVLKITEKLPDIG